LEKNRKGVEKNGAVYIGLFIGANVSLFIYAIILTGKRSESKDE